MFFFDPTWHKQLDSHYERLLALQNTWIKTGWGSSERVLAEFGVYQWTFRNATVYFDDPHCPSNPFEFQSEALHQSCKKGKSRVWGKEIMSKVEERFGGVFYSPAEVEARVTSRLAHCQRIS